MNKIEHPMKVSLTLFVSAFLLVASCLAEAEPLGLAGFYKGEGFSIKFDGERCFATASIGELAETKCLRKGSLLYIAPIVPKGERMIRNVWVAYTVIDDRLESSHLEDMDDGQAFYKDRRPKLILQRQSP